MKGNFWAEFWGAKELISLQELLGMKHAWGSRVAFELGCGQGLDTLSLLEHGFTVTAIDKSPDALERISSDRDYSNFPQLTFRQMCFHETELTACNLVHAKFALPFSSSREEFEYIWAQIVANLLPGGIFCGQLLGILDDWNGSHPLIFHTRNEVEDLLSDFEVLQFLEVMKNAPTSNSGEKFWHFFHLVLKKKDII